MKIGIVFVVIVLAVAIVFFVITNRNSNAAEDTEKQTEFFNPVTKKKHFEGQGDRWFSLSKESCEASGTVIEDFLNWKGDIIVEKTDVEDIALVTFPGNNIKTGYLVQNKKEGIIVRSHFPIMSGIPNKLKVTNIYNWHEVHDCEADIMTASEIGLDVSFFNPFFGFDKSIIKEGHEYEFYLAAWAYSAQKSKDNPILLNPNSTAYKQLKEQNSDLKEPITIYIEGTPIFMSTDFSSDYIYHLPIESVESVKLSKFDFYKIKTTFARSDSEIKGYLYVSKDMLKGYEPKVGDDIEGRLWLTGYLKHEKFIN